MSRQIFVSYAQKDKATVDVYLEELKKKLGDIFFIDDVELTGGDFIIRKIEEGIEACEILLLFYSEHSIKAKWVWYEFGIARAKNKTIEIISLNNVKPKLPKSSSTYIPSSKETLVCYSADDKSKIESINKQLKEALGSDNIDLFELKPLKISKQKNSSSIGEYIEVKELDEKIDTCAHLILLISKDYPVRPTLYYTVGRARAKGKNIYPVLIGDCRLPQILETYLAIRIPIEQSKS